MGSASVRVLGGLDNVAGVKIPQFETQVIPGDSKMDLAGEQSTTFDFQCEPSTI